MARQRQFSAFSLSFLDIMSCGFGAVILIYIIINHSTEATSQEVTAKLVEQATRLETRIGEESQQLLALRNNVSEEQADIVRLRELAARINAARERLEEELRALLTEDATDEEIDALRQEITDLEKQTSEVRNTLNAAVNEGRESVRTIAGEGDRQYLTGLRVGGEHVLILLDVSASMLDRTIVNVIRRRNLPEEEQRQSPKWQRAIRAVEWITANLPPDAEFQLYVFNEKARPAVDGTENAWLRTSESKDTDAVLDAVRDIIPTGGTSLINAFVAARKLQPLPDNIFLIVDSLPTQGETVAKGSVVDSRQRTKLFESSIGFVPQATPVNTILFPMEGDPLAAPAYWRLAHMTGGSFMSPSDDWP